MVRTFLREGLSQPYDNSYCTLTLFEHEDSDHFCSGELLVVIAAHSDVSPAVQERLRNANANGDEIQKVAMRCSYGGSFFFLSFLFVETIYLLRSLEAPFSCWFQARKR